MIERLNAALAGRYTVERELGAGGMATVWLAHDVRHDRRVAVKVLRPELAAAVGADRFLTEIRTTANLQHPHILPLFDSGEAGGFLYYVMPYIAGASLREHLERGGRLGVDEALAIAGDIAAALTFAHRHGVIHRDIKPENILLEDGEGLVADFGIALALSGAGARLTATGLAIGTPAYMSPEQAAGEPDIDGRSDQYALACVLFEMLTGEPPFTGPTVQAVLAKSLVEAPRAARALQADVPVEVDAALARALSKRREDRFDSPRDFIDACAPPPAPARRRRPTAAGMLLTAALVLVVAFPLWRSGQAARARASLPAIAALAGQGNYIAAFDLAVAAERYIAGDTALAALLEVVSDVLTITTEPAGASVWIERLPADEDESAADSVLIGTTPIRDLRVARADYRVVIRAGNYAPLERIASSAFARSEFAGASSRRMDLALTLEPAGSVPAGMVAVAGGAYTLVSPDLAIGLAADLDDFFMDRFEVTNRQYAEFIRAGGYADRSFWAAAAADRVDPGRFVDLTGLPGPRSWSSQEPPAGRDGHPVTDVSWYEASAFCAAAGKRLPTLYEWEKTARDGVYSHRGVIMPWGFAGTAARNVRRANFGGSGTVPADAFRFGISPYGAYAMAGNVKEWLANPAGDGLAVTGGSWRDPAYLFSQVGSLAGTTASPELGFRCARTAGPGPADQGAGAVPLDARTPVYEPVDAPTYTTLLSHYRYDRQPADPRGSQVVETADWTRERLWIDGLAGDSILVYLWLPKGAAPPFQTLVLVPGSGAFFSVPVWRNAEEMLAPHIKAGRAVLATVMKGMIERPYPPDFAPPASQSVRFRDLMVLHATELRLAIDWLETRGDIDRDRLAYIGVSWGSGSRLAFAAVDDRFRSVVLVGGGIDERVQPTLPEAANFNFAPYIGPPKLLINGRHDEEHPWNTRALPLWNLLREPKELVLIEGAGHIPPAQDRVLPINAFLDRTLGPVSPVSSPSRRPYP